MLCLPLPVPFGTNLNEKNKGLGRQSLSMSGKLFYYLRIALETEINFPFSVEFGFFFFGESQHSWKYVEILNENMTYCSWYYLLSRMVLWSALQHYADQQCSKGGIASNHMQAYISGSTPSCSGFFKL